MSASYVYIVWDNFCPATTSFVKIGISDQPYSRLQQLQTANPNYLYMDRLYSFDSRGEAEAVEKLLHKNLAKHKKRGEWFRFSKELEEKINGYEIFIGECVLHLQDNDYKEKCNYKNQPEYEDDNE